MNGVFELVLDTVQDQDGETVYRSPCDLFVKTVGGFFFWPNFVPVRVESI